MAPKFVENINAGREGRRENEAEGERERRREMRERQGGGMMWEMREE